MPAADNKTGETLTRRPNYDAAGEVVDPVVLLLAEDGDVGIEVLDLVVDLPGGDEVELLSW